MQCNPVAQAPTAHDAMHHDGAHAMEENPNTMPGATQGAGSRESRVLKSKITILLWIGWALAFALAAACFAVLLQGVARDARWGQPAIPVDFSEVSAWQSASFRVWSEDTYTLFVSSVNHDPEYIDRFLTADFRVRILGADEQPVLDRLYRGETLDHTVPRGYGDVRLATINIKGKPWRPGTLQVRVTEPDPAFRTTRSEVRLWKEQQDLGMGGLVNYAMLVPGGIMLVLSLLIASMLASRGRKWPLIATVLLILAIGVGSAV